MNKEHTTARNMQAINTEGIQFERYPAYKDSGVEWLGEVPAHWETLRMKRLFKDVSEKNKPDAELLSVTQSQGVVPRSWVETRMVMPSGNLESFKFIREGDFAISLRSFEGGLEYCHHEGIISPAYTVLRQTKDLYSHFYKYLFKSAAFISELQTSVVGIREGKNISYPELSYSFLPIPPLPEQTRIATFLDHKTALIDKAIAQKERLIELLQERRQVLIHRAVTRGLDPDVQMKDSGVEWIGEAPAHWEVKKLKYIVKFIGGGTPSKENAAYWKGDIPWISPKDMKKDEIEDSQDHISELAISNSSITLVPSKAVLIVVRGMILAHSFPTAILKRPGTINQDMKALVCKHSILPEYLQLFFKGMRDFIVALTSESSHGTKKLESSIFQNIEVFFPPIKEQRRILLLIEEEISKINLITKNMDRQIEKLQELKSTLIDAAVTGKIKV